MNSPVGFWVALPELVGTEPLPWWAYALMVVGLTLAGGVIRLEISHYRAVQTGTLVPKLTVDLIIAAKDAEILHLQEEVARWVGNYHIKDAAYTSLAEIIDENTDAMRALAIPPPAVRSASSSESSNARRGRERA